MLQHNCIAMNIRYLLVIVFLCVPIILMGQEIEITNVNLKGSQVEVRYNLKDERIDRSYSINLYTSKDNYIQPMEQVSGDIGIDISVGNNKVLLWDAKGELGDDFDGAVALELKGNYYVPFIIPEGIDEGKQFKRGTPYDFIWTGGRGDNILNIELYRGDNLITVFEERPNVGNTVLTIPSNVKPGTDYRFKISDSRNRDEVVFTNQFEVKRKFPLGLKIGTAFVVGVGVGILIKSLLPTETHVIDEPPLPALN